MKLSTYSWVIVLVLIACNNEADQPDPAPDTFFDAIELKNTASLSPASEHWIALSNSSGAVVALEKIEKDQVIQGKGVAENDVDVTIISKGSASVIVKTFASVATGSLWTFPTMREQEESGTKLTPTIEITEIPLDLDHNWLSTSVSNSHGSIGYTSSTTSSLMNATKEMELKLSEISLENTLLVMNDGIADPVYMWITEEMAMNAFTSIPFSELLPMDNILYFSFPGANKYYMDITGYDNDNLSTYNPLDGYLNSEVLLLPDTPNLQGFHAGYLDEFTTFVTRITITYSDKQYAYNKFGDPPSALTADFFQGDFTLEDTNIETFSYIGSGDWDLVGTSWSSEDNSFRWSLTAPINHQININELILAINSHENTLEPLPNDALHFKNATFYNVLSGEFNTFLDSGFYEYYSITKSN